jgi:hypothetical protein
MARTSHAHVMNLPDAATTWNFDLFVPAIPGFGQNNLTYKCKTTTLPQSRIEPIKIELHGVGKQEAGRALYEHTFTAMFMETVDYKTYEAFRNWRDFMRSWKNNTGTDSAAYKVNLELDVYDNGPNLVKTVILVGAFVTDIGEVAYNGAESVAVEMSITFSFDYLKDVNANGTIGSY